jgi:CRP-like cAMP-binding protein
MTQENDKDNENGQGTVDFLAAFPHVPDDLAAVAMRRIESTEHAPGTSLIREGDPNTRLYLIRTGSVEVVKQGREDSGSQHRIAVLGPGDQVGDMSVADGLPASATVRALSTVEADALDFRAMAHEPDLVRLHDAMLRGMVQKLAGRLRDSSQLSVKKLESELRLQRLRGTIARFIVVMLTLFALYTFFLRIAADLGTHNWVIVFGSPLIIVAFALAVLYMIRTSPLPARFFGLTTQGAGAAVRHALFWSAIFVILLTALKALAVNFPGPHQGQPIFTLGQAFVRLDEDGSVNWLAYLIGLGAYALLCPAQELIGRCGVQAPLYEFLEGSERNRHLVSILISNLIAAAAHVHLGIAMAVVTFVPGLFWGWLFTRHRSIVGVSVSHALIGSYAIFALGIENFLV